MAMCNLLEYPEKIQELFRLISTRATGKPKQLAKKLQISERTAKGWISQLNDYNYPVIYNREIESYVWKDDTYSITYVFKIEKQSIEKAEMNALKGGKCICPSWEKRI